MLLGNRGSFGLDILDDIFFDMLILAPRYLFLGGTFEDLDWLALKARWSVYY